MRVTLAPLDAALENIIVEIHQDAIAPQIVVLNKSSDELVILDEQARPFLRLGPNGVEADLASMTWYQSFAPNGIQPPATILTELKKNADTERWAWIHDKPGWGWFDPRLNVENSHGHSTRQNWQIPVLIKSRRLSIHGYMEEVGQDTGYWQAAINKSQLPEQIGVRIIQGPVPAIMLQNSGSAEITVLDGNGNQALRIGPAGVWANTFSSLWLAQRKSSRPEVPQWLHLSQVPRISWLEARLLPGEKTDTGKVHDWSIPIHSAEQTLLLSGTTRWRPAK